MSTARASRFGLSFWTFILFMLGLMALFVWLGSWQVARLSEKEALVANVEYQRVQPPYEIPDAGEWAGLDLEPYLYHPLTLTGRYINDRAVLVFTNLTDAKGQFSGPGFWVMTPFEPETGGIVFVNRGFIPQSSGNSFRAMPGPGGLRTLTGLALAAERATSFTPGPDVANRIEWLRDPVRLAAMAGFDGPIFPLTVDAPAGEPGALPQGGETVIEFRNNHLGYAITWFGFALITPFLLGYWVFREIRPARPENLAQPPHIH